MVTQALNEADEKGLTTVCIDTLAQFLVLQDGYHARDTYDNHALFVRYLVNTLLLMDREIMAARLRPGVDALVHLFGHDDNTFKPNEETQKIGAEMAASIKRIQKRVLCLWQTPFQPRLYVFRPDLELLSM